VALFHATTVPGILPSELLPHEDRVPLSRSLAPLQLSTSLQRCTVLRLVTAGFTDFHAFTQLPGFPSDYGLRFPGPKLSSPSSWAQLGGVTSFRQLHLLRSFPPLVRPYLQLWVTPPQPAVSLLGFLPCEAFSFHASGSLPTQAARA